MTEQPQHSNDDPRTTKSADTSPGRSVDSTGGIADWLRDFALFLRENKLWWILPICLAIGLVLLLAWLTREPERPPTYPYF